MSYASAAKENRLPEGQQPQPDPSLLEGHNQDTSEVERHIPGVEEKVNVVSRDVMEEIEREEKRAEQLSAAESERFKRKINEIDDAAEKDAKKAKAVDRRLHQRFQTNPKLWTGVMGVLNIASLAGVGYLAYANWTQPRWDRRVVTGVTAGLAALFVPQGIFATEEYEQRK